MIADTGDLYPKKTLWGRQTISGCLGNAGHAYLHLKEQVESINVSEALRAN